MGDDFFLRKIAPSEKDRSRGEETASAAFMDTSPKLLSAKKNEILSQIHLKRNELQNCYSLWCAFVSPGLAYIELTD